MNAHAKIGSGQIRPGQVRPDQVRRGQAVHSDEPPLPLRACPGKTLVFVETKKMAEELQRRLSNDGYDCRSIHGAHTSTVPAHNPNLLFCGIIVRDIERHTQMRVARQFI